MMLRGPVVIVAGAVLLALIVVGGVLAVQFLGGASDPQVLPVSQDQPAEIEFANGALLSAPAGAFSGDTTLHVQLAEKKAVPEVAGLHYLVSDLYDVAFAPGESQDFRSAVTLTIPYQKDRFTDPADLDALTLAWWDGETWNEAPTTVDPEAGTVSGELYHFSVFGAIYSEIKGMKYRVAGALEAGGYDASYQIDVFTIHYDTEPTTSTSGVAGITRQVADHRPSMEDRNGSGVPDYIERLGEALVASRRAFTRVGAELDVRGTVHVYVAELGYKEGQGGDLGMVTGIASQVFIDNSLSDADLVNTAAHELFHYYQGMRMGVPMKAKHFWWLEATAAWAMELVYPDLDLYIDEIRQVNNSESSPPAYFGLDNFPSGGSNTFVYAYGSAPLAFFLESLSPGIVVATFDDDGLAMTESWHETFDRLLRQRTGTGFYESLPRYFAHYYVLKVLHPDMPTWYPDNSPNRLSQETVIIGTDPVHRRLTTEIPPLGARMVSVLSSGANVPDAPGTPRGTLYVKPNLAAVMPHVSVFAHEGSGDTLARVPLPGESPDVGLLLDPGLLTIASAQSIPFSRPPDGMPYSQVHAVAFNIRPDEPAQFQVEIGFLPVVTGVTASSDDEGNVTVRWQAQNDPDGAVKRYQVHIQGLGLAAEAPAGATSVRIISRDLRDRSPVVLTVRSVGIEGVESPDSDPVTVTVLQKTPTPTLTPTPTQTPEPTPTPAAPATTIDLGGPYEKTLGEGAIFFRAEVKDLPPNIQFNQLQWQWDFGDGTQKNTDGNVASRRYTEAGTYTVTVAVLDREGNLLATAETEAVVSPVELLPVNATFRSDHAVIAGGVRYEYYWEITVTGTWGRVTGGEAPEGARLSVTGVTSPNPRFISQCSQGDQGYMYRTFTSRTFQDLEMWTASGPRIRLTGTEDITVELEPRSDASGSPCPQAESNPLPDGWHLILEGASGDNPTGWTRAQVMLFSPSGSASITATLKRVDDPA